MAVRGNILRRRRMELDLSARDVADKMGIGHYKWVYIHETAGTSAPPFTNPRPEIVHGYADLYGISTKEVVLALTRGYYGKVEELV